MWSSTVIGTFMLVSQAIVLRAELLTGPRDGSSGPWCEQREQLVSVVTQRRDDLALLPVGGGLDRVAQRATLVGDLLAGHERAGAQPVAGGALVRGRPRAGHRADQGPAPEVGEHADLAAVESGGAPRVAVGLVPPFANAFARAPHVDERIVAPAARAVRGRQGMALHGAGVGGASRQLGRPREALRPGAEDLGEVARGRALP